RVVKDRERESGGDRQDADWTEHEQRSETEQVRDPARVVDARAEALRALAVEVVVDDLGAVAAADRRCRNVTAAEAAGRVVVVALASPLLRLILRAALRRDVQKKEAAGVARGSVRLVQGVALGAMHAPHRTATEAPALSSPCKRRC